MQLSNFDYELPAELIAQEPAPSRTSSRMLVMNRRTGQCDVCTFPDILRYIREGDCLIFNDTRVIPARVYGRRSGTGGKVEMLFIEELDSTAWKCMMKPGRRMRVGQVVEVEGASKDEHIVVKKRFEDGTFEVEAPGKYLRDMIEAYGVIPLPPYIQRGAEPTDSERYQTVYARKPGAVAAPTAGLHFTPGILGELEARNVKRANVTLHVGPGTFRPVKSQRITDHKMHEERFELSSETARIVNRTQEQGGRIIAVGTTSVRVLETCVDPQNPDRVLPGSSRTRLFLHPPMKPKITDGLLTNFHLPRSTLLMLVATFSTTENVLAAYRLAIKERFRFYSYGDCMLLLP